MGVFDGLRYRLEKAAVEELNCQIRNGDHSISIKRYGKDRAYEWVGVYRVKDIPSSKGVDITDLIMEPRKYADITNYDWLK